ncbi:hypothetical protein BR63_16740 [Thermanaerosceptrum fracticalcis]|uniref:Uncharacterized protein n=1 Tax=Thermanaerosceptrum fracticalcis TaxID=1712410 RepID=A0A7G6E6R9_THEFR|nr:hypothetical protein [Thermanaerosceptrum fracticalcis]QNB47773.1 hypothetical protein BR63_16740 [Thermanaerosceptrum fracticalcis]
MMDPRRNILVHDEDDILAREIIRENIGGKDPELSLVDDFLEELELRLEQVKVYYPIMELLRKRKTEEEFSGLVPELCFLTLSYLIYEGKLKHKGITFQDLQAFLAKALQQIMTRNLESEKTRKLTVEILDGLQNGGRNFILNTYSFKSGNFREKYVKFLEIKQSEEGVLQYYITEQGVDFYLKTKEFPEETQITINLLLFQKQMEKGAFGFAYETVRRLNMEVQKKKDRKYSLLEALIYGRLDLGEAYNSYHHSIVMQFQEEAELFTTAVKNVSSAYSEYVERINNGEATDKEIRTFTLIKIIEKEISRAQTLHTQLLKEAVGFTKEYDQALAVRRKAIFTERFNFQGELEKLMNQNEKPEALKFLFEPLLNPYVRKSFNPLRVLEPQRVTKSRQEDEESPESDLQAGRETIDHLTGRRVRKNFLFYATRLLKALDTSKRQIGLQDFCKSLIDRYSEDIVYNGDFLSFLLEMNRDKSIGEHSRIIRFGDGKIQLDEELKTMEEVFIQAALAAHMEGKINQVTVQSFPEEEVELLPGLKITNMLFRGERN